MLRGRTDTLRWHLNRAQQLKLCPAICRHLRGRYLQVVHRLSTASNSVELRSFSKSKWATHLAGGWKGPSARRQTEDSERWPASTPPWNARSKMDQASWLGIPRAFWGGSSGFSWAVARTTVKVDTVHGFDNPEAFGKAICLYIERTVHLRKLGAAGLFALGTAKIFNPTVAGRHLPNMRLRRSCSIPTPLRHSN
jgi:hypothetical protein